MVCVSPLNSLCDAGDDIEEMVAAVRHALQQCCVQLKSKIARKQAVQEQRDRKRTLSKHIPNAAFAMMQVLKVRARPAIPAVRCWAVRCATMLPRILSGV